MVVRLACSATRLARRNRAGVVVGISNLRGGLRLRTQRNCQQQLLMHQRESVRYNQFFSNRSVSPNLLGSYAFDIENYKPTAQRFRPGRLFSTNNTPPTTPLPSDSMIDALPLRASDDESFAVTKITTGTGEAETIQISQTEIIRQTSLSPRDLVSLRLATESERKRDWAGNTLMEQMRHPPTIMARNDFILLSLGPVRAVAEPHAVYLFDVHSKAADSFTKYLSEIYQKRAKRLEHNPSHFEEPSELVFLETVLADAVDSFSSRIRIFEPIVNDLLLKISEHEEFSDANLVHQMAPLMEQLKSFEIFVTQAYECLMQLLNDDEAMLQLLLTEQEGKSRNSTSRWLDFGFDSCTLTIFFSSQLFVFTLQEARQTNTTVAFERHQHVEHILGIYARRFGSIIQQTKYLLGRIESKQDFIELELDLYRNRLIRMNLDLAILATATGVTTALTGTFGMNMINGLEESATAFGIVSGCSAMTALGVGYYFRRMVSGKVIQKRAEQRIDEIRTMSDALSDMTALDYTVKKMIRGTTMSREEFKEQLTIARQSKQCSKKEIDLLFDVLNTQRDDVLGKDDFLDKEETKGTKN